MAFRYRQRYFATDDALNIDDWNHNMKELAEEFNGYLDRDNFPNGSFGQAQIVDNAFNKVHYTSSGTTWTPDPNTTSWQHDDGSGNLLLEQDIDCAVDCLLLIELGAESLWSGTINDGNVMRHKVAVDGVTVAESGWVSQRHLRGSIWIAGALPVGAGPHKIEHYASTALQFQLPTIGMKVTTGTPTVGDRQLLIIERRR